MDLLDLLGSTHRISTLSNYMSSEPCDINIYYPCMFVWLKASPQLVNLRLWCRSVKLSGLLILKKNSKTSLKPHGGTMARYVNNSFLLMPNLEDVTSAALMAQGQNYGALVTQTQGPIVLTAQDQH